MSKDRINVTEPFLPHISEYNIILRGAWANKMLTNGGELHNELQAQLADYLGVKYISLFCNGTQALITAFKALELTGSVITTPFSFIATRSALEWIGLKPIFVDIAPGSFNIDAEKIERSIRPDTTAILPVHCYGYPCDVDTIDEIAERRGLKVVYDACHSFRCYYGEYFNKLKSVFNYGDLSVCSFHATKVFTTFEGGCIVSHTQEMYEKIERLKNFGFKDGNVVDVGVNCKMSEAHAAMGLLQLKYIDLAIEKRRDIWKRYHKNLGLNPILEWVHNYSYLPLLFNDRDKVYDALVSENIYPRKYFSPTIADSFCENAEEMADHVLCLPIYPDLKHSDVDRICEIINQTNEQPYHCWNWRTR